jgi:streptogramin lyase
MLLRVVAALLVAFARPHATARVATGLNPCGAVAAYGAVWVANDGSGTLTRIDPKRNRVTRRIAVGKGACSVAAGAGAVWVTNYKTRSVLRVDPRTGRVRAVRVGDTPFDVVVDGGRVWATVWREGMLVELDPGSLEILRRLDVGPFPTGLTTRRGEIWVGFGRDATSIAVVDPATGSVEHVPVGVKAPSWFASGTSDLWIQADDNALVHVAPYTRGVLGIKRIGRTLAQGALASDGMIWMPDKETDTIYRVDPRTSKVVDSFRGGDGAFCALRAFGSLWVTSYAGADVWRFDS